MLDFFKRRSDHEAFPSVRPQSPLHKRVITISVIAFLLICGGIALIFALRGPVQDIFMPAGQVMRVYFFNSQTGTLQGENIPVELQDFGGHESPGERESYWVNAAFANMRRPAGRGLSSTWPEAVYVIGYFVDDRVLSLTFSESYLELPALDEALFRTALTLTLTAGPYIDEVVMRIGDNGRTETAATVFNVPELSPARLANITVVLYYACESGEGLVRDYAVVRDANTRETDLAALERLIAGPVPEGAVSLIPAETRVRVLRDPDTRGLYVLLSGEFSTRFSGGPAQAQLAVQSIVNTALSNSVFDLRQVFFLIDSARESQFHGVHDFDRGFEYDETVMVGFVPEEED